MTEKSKELLRNMVKVGTPECAIFMGFLGLALGVMFLLLGFWQTLLVALIVLVFAFLGGVRDKKAFIGKLIDKVFPPKNDNFPGSEQAGRNKTEYPHVDHVEFKAPSDPEKPMDTNEKTGE